MPDNTPSVTVLGIDPGTKRVGYGVVQSKGASIKLIDAGVFAIVSDGDPDILSEIRNGVVRLIIATNPTILSLEKIYFSKNQKTAIQVAQARGVIIEAAAGRHMRVLEFGPSEVKKGIAGFGHADKKAVLKMVKLFLNEPRLDVIDDASDALALAILATRKFAVDNSY